MRMLMLRDGLWHLVKFLVLAPIASVLWVLSAIFIMIGSISGALLYLISGLFILAGTVAFFQQEWPVVAGGFIFGFLCSPFGLPGLVMLAGTALQAGSLFLFSSI